MTPKVSLIMSAFNRERFVAEVTFHFQLVRRCVFDAVGGFDPTFRYAQDDDRCLRLSETTRIERIEQPLYDYRVHDNSVSMARQMEQVACARRAVENALSRRGMDDQWTLEVYVEPRFVIRRKTASADRGSD
ncbi:MAG: hypothetical protein WD534_04240 [Phycisphaeraceae bacterium]